MTNATATTPKIIIEQPTAETACSEQRSLAKSIAPEKPILNEHAEQILAILLQAATAGQLHWQKNVTTTLTKTIKALDQKISKQLSAVFHHPNFKQLEGCWRGLHDLVKQAETGTQLKIKLLSAPKALLQQDFAKASEFDQSQLFKKIYETEFGTAGGEPMSVLLADYEFDHSPAQLEFLNQLAKIGMAAFCPVITAPKPALLGLSSWSELSKPRDLAKIFDTAEYIGWRNLRDKDESRFLVLTMPRMLARVPYQDKASDISAEFCFDEIATSSHNYATNQQHKQLLAHEDYCWTSAIYGLGHCLAQAFAQYGWCTAIRGVESGGKVAELPLYFYTSDDGDQDLLCPTEIAITDRREAELGRLGFLPLCHYRNTQFAVFFGAQTVHAAKRYDTAEATANALIATRLSYLLATSRITHYLKIIARDRLGSHLEASDLEVWLNRWINRYVNGNKDASTEMKAKYPLAAAKISVIVDPNSPGHYQLIAWLRPWLQLEELTASLRLVTHIPQNSVRL